MSAVDNARDHAVQRMFDRIAGRYDLLNRVISFRLDKRWRNKVVQAALSDRSQLILDLGAGTGDLTFAAAGAMSGKGRIIGLDFSWEMLRLAQEKKSSARNHHKVAFVLGSALCSPFHDALFDSVMTAFVLRNVSDLNELFAQAFRVLRPEGRLVSLDMFPPQRSLFCSLYSFYFYRLVPWIGGLLANDQQAYRYLSQSVQHFHSPETVAGIIEGAGFKRVTIKKFLHGAVCMHVAER